MTPFTPEEQVIVEEALHRELAMYHKALHEYYEVLEDARQAFDNNPTVSALYKLSPARVEAIWEFVRYEFDDLETSPLPWNNR